ncbi:hypothetical protein BGZ99_008593 [Dissophora globulifera]|uniref:Uncharacterized protein n=1 Tax=Dissophora globulifera TaxID=979702 RepID=A0A9P6RAM2_9FUNG|nr:hypothetical protein BGZ99_008593 [Dissophora globulifera]
MQHQQHRHQHLQQHRYPQHQFPCTLTDSQEPYLISDRSSTLPCPQNDLIAARVYVPLSPDLGYLEAINAYFVLHPDDPSTAVDSLSENDSQTEDDDEEELQWNKHDSEAHKHDSDAYKHDSYAYKHVTHALAPPDYSRIEDIEPKSGCSSQHPSHMREAICDTDNDSDMDASFQIGTKVERSAFCELSASDATCKIDDNNENGDNRALTSPLSRSQGTDSGYMSLSYNFLDLQFETLANDIAVRSCTAPGHEGTSLPHTITQTDQHSLNDSNDMAIRHEELMRENSMNAPSAPPPLPQPPPPSSSVQPPPPPPPRYPEIDARVFDQVEGEGSDNNIFYAPMENSVLDSTSETYELRPIIAATIVKLIEKLTHQYGMNSGFISDFFLTYRLFMSPVQLCKYLIQRYLWALEQDTESRCVVRIRTFVVIRYWINNYFADDFSTSKSLRFQMASFLDAMRSNPHVQASARDSRIIRNLTELFKYQRKYHRGLAKQSMAADEHNDNTDNDERRTAEVERLEVSTIHRHPEPAVIGLECGAVLRTVHPTTPVKGRHRASTLAGTTSHGSHMLPSLLIALTNLPWLRLSQSSKPPLQLSEGGAIIVRERRVSTSSIKSNRSGINWSAKMTLGINKLRQKSEDIYQQFVHPISLSQKADNKSCVCWDPEYTGITEHHALNTTRSHPTMRPSVIITSTSREGSISQPFATHAATMGLSSNRPIRRFKSSLSLGQSSPTTMPSPAPSPTKNQFSSNSSRHSRSNSNSSMGYHPNPDCPYHVPCLVTMNREPGQKVQGLRDENDHATLQEALQDDFADLIAQAHSLLMSSTPATSLPPSPAWNYSPWHAASQYHHESASSSAFSYKPFILFYRSQLIAQQLCLLEQHFLEQVRWDELLEMELTKAGRKIRFKNQSSASGCPSKAENERNGMEASNERSNMLCMWVASEVVSTHPIEDRVRVIEKFIRIAQKCYHYRNYNSLIQLVMGLGSSHLCGLRRTWARVSNFEMRVLHDLQDFISPCGNWSIIRKAMGKIDYQETLGENENAQRFSLQSLDSVNISAKEFNTSGRNAANESSHSKLLHHQTPVDKQGCIPFLGLFVFDLTHIAVSPPWYLPPESSSSPGEIHILGGEPSASQSTTAPVAFSGLQEPDPTDIQELMSTGQLLVHFHRFQLIAKTIKWFTAFQRRPQKYTFPVDNTLYSKCFLLRVLSNEQVRELADNCEPE